MHESQCNIRSLASRVTDERLSDVQKIRAELHLSCQSLLPRASLTEMCKDQCKSMSLAIHVSHTCAKISATPCLLPVMSQSHNYVQRSVQKFHVSCPSCLSKLMCKDQCNSMSLASNVITSVSVSDDVQQLEQPAVFQLVLLSATHWPCLCY